MFVYSPKELYHAWPAFYAFVDFLIRMIDEDKVEVIDSSSFGTGHGPADFYIWLSANKGVEESVIHLSYDWRLGYEPVTPIKRFGFTFVGKGLSVLLNLRSKDADSYDKMLELFRAVMRYIERHNPERHREVVELISGSISSLDRKDWKKSKKAIEEEFSETWQARQALETLKMGKARGLSELTNKYKQQGYEIVN